MNQNRFSLPLAVVDALPVLLFLVNCILIGRAMHSGLFVLGAALCCAAGFFKVIWKICIAASGKDHAWLNHAFLPVMLTGFVLLILGIVLAIHAQTVPSSFLLHLTRAGAFVSFAIALLFLIALIVIRSVFGKKKFNTSETLNWIGEGLNIGFQAAVLSGILFMH